MMGEFTWTALIGLMTLLFTGLAALLGVWWKMEMRIRSVEEAARARSEANAEKTAALRVMIAEKYVSYETMREVENRLGSRMDALADQVTNMPEVVVKRIMDFLTLKDK